MLPIPKYRNGYVLGCVFFFLSNVEWESPLRLAFPSARWRSLRNLEVGSCVLVKPLHAIEEGKSAATRGRVLAIASDTKVLVSCVFRVDVLIEIKEEFLHRDNRVTVSDRGACGIHDLRTPVAACGAGGLEVIFETKVMLHPLCHFSQLVHTHRRYFGHHLCTLAHTHTHTHTHTQTHPCFT